MTSVLFYCPFGYFLSTRLETFAAKISWLLVYFVPLLLTVFSFSSALDLISVGYLAVGTISVYLLYEIGYIENDTLTVLQEPSPTIRLDDDVRRYVSEHWWKIVLFRSGILIICLWWIRSAPGFEWFVAMLAGLIPAFYLYNRIRSSVNAVIHPILVTIRFCGPVVLLIPYLNAFAFALLLFPLLNGLERAAESRYGIKWLQGLWLTNQVSGRWSYYGILLVLVVAYSYSNASSWWVLLPVVYLFLFRLLTAFIRPEKVSR